MYELFELLDYLTWFWRFVFYRKFRNDWIVRFKYKGAGGKLLELLSALIATVVGLGIPVIIMTVLFNRTLIQA